MPDSNRSALIAGLEAVMREAGALALASFKTPVRQWTKEGSSPVSEADIAVNDLLRARLPALAPQAGWLSEETEDDRARLEAAQVWVVDPIDGTRGFLAQRDDWCISVALVEDGRPLIAALYAPATDELFLASRGGGATRNGASMRIGAEDGLDGARIAGPKGLLGALCGLNPRIVAQPKIFSLAIRVARVACGDLEAAFAAKNSHDWDLAATDLLLHEAGGVLTDLGGQPLTYNRPDPVHGALIAAGLERHQTLLDLLRDRHIEFT